MNSSIKELEAPQFLRNILKLKSNELFFKPQLVYEKANKTQI